jgi:hypothetical protein
VEPEPVLLRAREPALPQVRAVPQEARLKPQGPVAARERGPVLPQVRAVPQEARGPVVAREPGPVLPQVPGVAPVAARARAAALRRGRAGAQAMLLQALVVAQAARAEDWHLAGNRRGHRHQLGEPGD